MATTPRQILAAVGTAITTLHSVPASGVNQTQLVFLNFANKTAADITIDLVHENAAATVTHYLGDDIIIPAKGILQWTGLFTFTEASSKIRATASATGVDTVGTVLEYS